MEKIKISVCMATYNGEDYIEEQLQSILRQLSDSDEVIISDDSSMDSTIEIIEGFEDSRIRLLVGNEFKSPIKNFENAIGKASGDIIFLTDQDDIWNADKISILTGHLKTNLLVYSNVNIFFGRDLSEARPLYKKKKKQTLFGAIARNKCIGATIAFKKELLPHALPFPDNIPMHDVWLYCIADVYGRVYYEERALVYYRRHERNASTSGEKSSNSFFAKLQFRVALISSLIKRVVK